MNRRDFLKILYGFAAGIIALYILRMFSIFTKPSNDNRSSAKNAQFYRQADHLAG